MSARQIRSFEAGFLAEDIGNQSNEMVGHRLAGRYIPSLDERCPIEFDAHHVIDALGDFR